MYQIHTCKNYAHVITCCISTRCLDAELISCPCHKWNCINSINSTECIDVLIVTVHFSSRVNLKILNIVVHCWYTL